VKLHRLRNRTFQGGEQELGEGEENKRKEREEQTQCDEAEFVFFFEIFFLDSLRFCFFSIVFYLLFLSLHDVDLGATPR
jgi:hypothetical protein